jgi:hypothetical protein
MTRQQHLTLTGCSDISPLRISVMHTGEENKHKIHSKIK